MKISQTHVQLSSYHAQEEADFIQEEIFRETRADRAQRFLPSGIGRRAELPSVWVDRVSISSRRHQEIQSEYTAEIASHSKVKSGTDNSVVEFSNEELVSRVVGGAMDREVTIRTLRDGDDIRSGKPSSSGGGAVSTLMVTPSETLVIQGATQIRFEQEQMGFSSQGRVMTEDGREVEFSLDLNMDRAFLSRTEEQTILHTWQEKVSLVDPLVISMDGSISELTDTRFEFDLDNDGTSEEISFVSKGSGFLSFDRNGDNQINDGSELFGPGTGNGFNELGEFDLDKNGWIDENDDIYSKLSVWSRDDHGNDVLISLKEARVGAIYLDHTQAKFNMTTMDNELKGQVRQSGVFLFENGNVGSVQQIDLAARGPETDADDLLRPPAARPSSPSFDRSGLRAARDVGNLDQGQGENPFQVLMDQIRTLREEVQQILGKDSESRNRFRGLRSTTFSDFQLYRMTHPDYPMGIRAGRSWQG